MHLVSAVTTHCDKDCQAVCSPTPINIHGEGAADGIRMTKAAFAGPTRLQYRPSDLAHLCTQAKPDEICQWGCPLGAPDPLPLEEQEEADKQLFSRCVWDPPAYHSIEFEKVLLGSS